MTKLLDSLTQQAEFNAKISQMWGLTSRPIIYLTNLNKFIMHRTSSTNTNFSGTRMRKKHPVKSSTAITVILISNQSAQNGYTRTKIVSKSRTKLQKNKLQFRLSRLLRRKLAKAKIHWCELFLSHQCRMHVHVNKFLSLSKLKCDNNFHHLSPSSRSFALLKKESSNSVVFYLCFFR